MAKEISCAEVGGMDCDFIARAETEEELMEVVRHHGREVHGMDEIPPELQAKMKEAIREV